MFKSVGCSTTCRFKFPKYFSWGWNTWPRFSVRVPKDAAALHLSPGCVSKSAQSVSKSACWRSAHVRLGVLAGVLSKPCIKAWLTSQHSGRFWRSQRHFQDLDFTYQHSGRFSGPSPRGICTVTCCRKALCARGADYYICRGSRGSGQALFLCAESLNVLNIHRWQVHPLNVARGKCTFHECIGKRAAWSLK